MLILNCMNHELTEDQKIDLENKYGENIYREELLLENLKDIDNSLFCELSNIKFNTDLKTLASRLVSLVSTHYDVIILPIGSPAFMFEFAKRRDELDCDCLFSHTERNVVETKNYDGSIMKTSVFKHIGFIYC